jgi:hypothetical protein
VLDEFYRIAFRKRLYASIVDLQDGLDLWVKSYNEERPHQGRWCFGKTPLQTFLDGIPVARGKNDPCLEGASRGDLFPDQEAGHRCSAGKARARGQAPRRGGFREQNIVEKLARAFRPGEGKRVRSCVVARNFKCRETSGT